MAMSRKDYRILADALKNCNASSDTCTAVALALHNNYSNFNYNKFLDACKEK